MSAVELPRSEMEGPLISALIQAPQEVFKLCDKISAATFSEPKHGILFSVVSDFIRCGKAVDFHLMVEELKTREQLEEIGDKIGLNEIRTLVPSREAAIAAAPGYISNVREAHAKRSLYVSLTRIAKQALDPAEDSVSLRTKLQELKTESIEPILRTASPAELIEPWPEPVEGATLLDAIVDVVKRHVVLSHAQAVAIALWIMLTHTEAFVDVLPILGVTSPQKRCGKTTLLSVLNRLVFRPMPASSISQAAVYRSVAKWRPTLLIDEADTFLKDNEELRGILNSGHTRELAFVVRSHPKTFEPERFSTWCPKALASIGALPETLTDRSIHIALQRRGSGEQVTKLRDSDPDMFERLRRQAIRWARDNGPQIRETRPHLPEALNDRAADNWNPMLAIANIAGRAWYDRAFEAAKSLSLSEADENLSIVVLSEVRKIFAERGEEFLPTEDLVTKLNENKEAPWADWKAGITAKRLGSILREYNVASAQHRIGDERKRGYHLAGLKAVFSRYLSATLSQSVHPCQSTGDQVLEPFHAGSDQIKQSGPTQIENSIRSAANPDKHLIGELRHGCHGLNGEEARELGVTKRTNEIKTTTRYQT
jgi:hypothetical protein